MPIENIAIMTAWNSDSGVYIHAEPIVNAWIKMGYNVKVFTFIKEDFHGRVQFGEDEPFVTRCFGTSGKTNYLDPRPLLVEKFDVLVMEDLKQLPMEKLIKLFPILKKKTKAIIHVLHENTILGYPPPQPPVFYAFDFDAVVYIEKKQEWFAKAIYGDKAYYIPFPCFPVRQGDKIKIREELGLPKDKKIVLAYARGGYSVYLPKLPREGLENVLFLVLTGKEIKWQYPQTEIRVTPPLPNDVLDKYVLASDAVILHKISDPPFPLALTSSATYHLIGNLRPLLAPRISEFFEPFPDIMLKYADREHLAELIIDAINLGHRTKKVLENAKKFVMERDPEKIAAQYIELFEKLI